MTFLRMVVCCSARWSMRSKILFTAMLVVMIQPIPAADAGVVEERFEHRGRERVYRMLVPEESAAPPALVLLLHGSGRDLRRSGAARGLGEIRSCEGRMAWNRRDAGCGGVVR